MASPVIQNNFRARKTFAKIAKIIDIPNLIDIQKQSYEKFLQKDVPLDKREDVGLQGGIFPEIFRGLDGAKTEVLKAARLWAVHYLRVTNTCDEVLALALGFNRNGALSVDFRGRKRFQFSTDAPREITVQGTCRL